MVTEEGKRGEVPYSCKDPNTEEGLCELGICAYCRTSLYLPHTIRAHPSIGYYTKQTWTGWLFV